MNPTPERNPMLKELKLSGILDSLDIRNREAIEEKLPYTDFLTLLLQDEIARRANRKLNNRIKKAGFRNHKTLETFDFSFNPTINRAQIMDLATGRFIEEKVCALVVGPCGTGKNASSEPPATPLSVSLEHLPHTLIKPDRSCAISPDSLCAPYTRMKTS
jgi:DNA replication protein DnaC